jgi:hypothetical protein
MRNWILTEGFTDSDPVLVTFLNMIQELANISAQNIDAFYLDKAGKYQLSIRIADTNADLLGFWTRIRTTEGTCTSIACRLL